MKQVSVDECPVGPALDAAVAKVLGWTVLDAGAASPAWETPEGKIRTWEPTSFGRWRPSDDIRAAWGLIEKFVLDSDWEFYLASYSTLLTKGWSANFRESPRLDWMSTDAETAPLAIIRAYLKAKGVEYIEVSE